jgi:hypothetical protein
VVKPAIARIADSAHTNSFEFLCFIFFSCEFRELREI